MSIVRVGLAETRKFAEGYEAIFGKKKEGAEGREKPARAGSKGKKGARKARKK